MKATIEYTKKYTQLERKGLTVRKVLEDALYELKETGNTPIVTERSTVSVRMIIESCGVLTTDFTDGDLQPHKEQDIEENNGTYTLRGETAKEVNATHTDAILACPRCGNNVKFSWLVKPHDHEGQMYSLQCDVCGLSGLDTNNINRVEALWNWFVNWYHEEHKVYIEFVPIIKEVMEKVAEHSETWRDKPEDYWLARFMQEVGEVAGSLVGNHEHPVELELIQIAAICINWIAMRKGSPNA